ncbi:MAG: class II glutamine amidotransferase [Planctomycetota bacterium]
MSEDLRHECGLAALCWLDRPAAKSGPAERLVSSGDVVSLMPGMLLDLQNRGQLAAGLSSFRPGREQLLTTCKGLGTVAEAFGMSNGRRCRELLAECAGPAAIGHTRYATCGADDIRHAQPFERRHGRLWKWFCFAFNGNLANFTELRDRLLARQHYHFSLNTDTEMILHALSYQLRRQKLPDLRRVMSSLARAFDGACNLAFLDAMGRLFVARDPLGFRPLSWAVSGRLFAAASESVALANMGFTDIRDVAPGEMAIVENGRLRFERFAKRRRHAHCFFEWVYFSNVASIIAGSSVYAARSQAGRRLAEREDQKLDDSCIVVPVPDTAKAAADAFAYRLGIPPVEGLIRNRYVGRTFIESLSARGSKARSKYTPLPAVISGKRVFLVEDSIVRATTLAQVAGMLRQRGGARQVHVRVACPPIIAPCFYGIDMSSLSELFAAKYIPPARAAAPSEATMAAMAKALGVDSLRYLAASDLGSCLGVQDTSLCTGCVTGDYPTTWGRKLTRRARRDFQKGIRRRAYEGDPPSCPCSSI